MNRAERKRAEREAEKEKKVYIYNEKQMNATLDEKKKYIKLEIIQELFGVMMVSLRDEFGWFSNKLHGKNRINRFITRFNENMAFIDAGETKLKDYNEWCEENNIRYEVRKMAKE